MNRLSLAALPALFAVVLFACGTPPKAGCKSTGCSAGSVCNTNSGACELIATGGGTGGGATGGGTGGGTTGGGTTGGGTGGGTTGGGTGGGGLVVDPFEDGGTFVPGDICSRAIELTFDGGTSAVGTGDLAAAQDQYDALCSDSPSGADLLFAFTLTEPKGVTLTANDTTSGQTQDLTLTLLASPCPAVSQVQCRDTSAVSETLDFARLPAGTWYVLVENYSDTDVAGTIDVSVDLRDPVAGPANDTCAMAQPLTLMNGMTMVSGTTTGALNDTGAAALTCSNSSRSAADVFYSFTLTQPQDVRVTVTPTMGSALSPAVAITTTCGAAGATFEQACNSNTPATAVARRLAAGTYFIVVDGDASATSGDFDLAVVTTMPSTPPANDTCAAPATLMPNVSQTIDANTGTRDYTLSCRTGQGGDVVYQFTLAQPQKVTLTATGMNGADGIVSLRGAPCDMDTAERGCVDAESSAPEVLTLLYVPAGTWYVVVQAYGTTEGTFGVSLALDAPVLPPANDSCTAPATLSANVSQMVELASAATDYTVDCSSYLGGDAVYAFTTTAPQRVVVTVTGSVDSDAVLELRGAPCETGASVRCADNESTGGETVTANNLPAGTYYVVLGSNGTETQFGIQLSVEPPRPVTNETCAAANVVTFTAGMASRSVDLADAVADLTLDCATSADGQDVVYSVTIPAMQTLTVVAAPVGASIADPVLAVVQAGMCMAMSTGTCVDSGGSNADETLMVPNTTAAQVTVFIVLKGYDATEPGEVSLTFSVQ